MKLNKIAYSLFISGVLAGGAAQAATTSVAGGSINFEGQVVDAACAISADSLNQTVILDQVKAAKLATAGQAAGQPVAFQIVLSDCDSAVSQNAAVTFSGQADATSADTLANTAGAGAATNVALQLYGPDGQKLPLGTASSAVTLNEGTNTLPFSVDYIATGAAATAGSVAATATFSMNYS